MRRTTALLSAGALALAGALIAGPASADEGDLTLDRTTVKAGETVTATLAGCEGFEFGAIALFAADADPETDAPIAEANDIELDGDALVGTVVVPATTEAGDYVVAAFCAADETEDAEGNADFADVTVEAAATPEPTTPTAEPAKPVVKNPKYTG
jgi:hypothetical protein